MSNEYVEDGSNVLCQRNLLKGVW